MIFSLIFGAAIPAISRERDFDTGLTVTATGAISAEDDCGLPKQGECRAQPGDCSFYSHMFCPDWEAIAIDGDCVIKNARKICCDAIPEPCSLRWHHTGAKEQYCSLQDDCLRPSCQQETYYLKGAYPKDPIVDDKSAFPTDPIVDDRILKCFFASAQQPKCGDKDADFIDLTRLDATVPVLVSELEKRAAGGDDPYGSSNVDQSTEQKSPEDSNLSAEKPSGLDLVFTKAAWMKANDTVRRNTLEHVRSPWNDNGTAAFSEAVFRMVRSGADDDDEPQTENQCAMIRARRRMCQIAPRWIGKSFCKACLANAFSAPPKCPGTLAELAESKLDGFGQSYCRCLLL